MLYQVTSHTGSLTCRKSAPFARLLALLLLVLVTYAATAESVHRHGALLSNTRGNSAPAITSSGDSGSLANDARASGECLICQLRQQLSFSLVSAPSLIISPTPQLARSIVPRLSSLSETAAPRRGRAPPLTS
jgi:hypothetical protein